MKVKTQLLTCSLASLCFLPLACAQAPDADTIASPALAPVPANAINSDALTYTFVYRAERKLRSVNVAGTFNTWNKAATPLQVDADGLTWRATLPLKAGKYLYKFVLDGTDWVTDPTTELETDGDGNNNSLLTLTAAGNTSHVTTTFTKGNADQVTVLTPDKIKSPDAIAHTFVYRADRKLDAVNVAGGFNGWSKDGTPLQADADGLTWRTTVSLAPGPYQYKFVLNGNDWVLDPAKTRRFTEADGNVNSLLVLEPSDYKTPASPSDGQTAASALRHDEGVPDLNYDQGQLRFQLRARPRDVGQVWLQVGAKRLPLSLVKSDDVYAYYATQMAWDGKTDLSYTFGLKDGNRTESFGANGLSVGAAPARAFRISAKSFAPFAVPSWVEKTVFYQIFPDRFANGDKSNDPTNVVAWNATPTGGSRFGGDLAGVQQHLPYLKSLGVSGVYFNPVFASPSNHRYDVTDYKRIDPQLGTNAEFAALTREMQKSGIRTVMDFVFNHSATSFAPFADVRKNGAASTYKDWYLVKSFPIRVQDPPNYVGWYGFSSMPKLNVTNPATSDYLLGLVNYWNTQVPLAGLRLDAADEVDIRFWRQLRTRVKGIDPQTWIVGERWSDATPWLRGDQWDGAMNYPFLFANSDFFADGKTSASQFGNRLMEIYNSYPPQVSRNMMNLLSSHDVPRFLTRCKNDERLQKLAATVQFTWVGAPSIYYGEELGMQGAADPDNRRGMTWDKATDANPMLSFYKRLVAVRNGNSALQAGTPAILASDDAAKTLAYSRTSGGEMAIVALNRSDKAQTVTIPLPQNAALAAARPRGLTDALSGKPYALGTAATLKVELAPFASVVLVPTARS